MADNDALVFLRLRVSGDRCKGGGIKPGFNSMCMGLIPDANGKSWLITELTPCRPIE